MEDISKKIDALAEKAAQEAPQKEVEKQKSQRTTKLADLIQTTNERFQALSDMQFQIMSFCRTALNELNENLNETRKSLRQTKVQASVQDVSVTALLEVLLEKGVLSQEEYKEKAQSVYNRVIESKGEEAKDS